MVVVVLFYHLRVKNDFTRRNRHVLFQGERSRLLYVIRRLARHGSVINIGLFLRQRESDEVQAVFFFYFFKNRDDSFLVFNFPAGNGSRRNGLPAVFAYPKTS